MAENALEIVQIVCLLNLKAWPSPNFQGFKSLDPPQNLLQNFTDTTNTNAPSLSARASFSSIQYSVFNFHFQFVVPRLELQTAT